MANGFTNIFGGQVINPAYLSYIQYQLTSLVPQIQLSWPTEFVDTPNNVSCIVEVTATNSGYSLVMPNAENVSVGQAVLFVNVGSNTVTVYLNDGATILCTLIPSQSTYCYLINNSTVNGMWRQIPWGGGSAAVISVAAISTSGDLVITGSPITNAGTFVFSLAEDLSALTGFGSGTGIAVRTATDTWELRSIIGTANQIVVTNGNGVAGNPTLALAQNISGITSITASNIQIGVNGTNRISTVNNAPLLINQDVGIENQHGLIFFDGTDIGFVAFNAPPAVAASQDYILPTNYPAVTGYVLSSTTGGTMSWVANGSGSGSVTNIATGVGLRGGPITNTGTINVTINDFCDGRLSLVSGNPVPITDTTAATTIYFTPYKGNYIALYTAATWTLYTFTELSIAVPGVANQMYDLFVYDNSGVLTLVTQIWTSDTARLVNLTTQDGVYVLTGFPNYRYLGSFRTKTAGQCNDTLAFRHLWNYYNRIVRDMVVQLTGSWSYNTLTYRQANATASYQLDVVIGVSEDALQATYNNMAATTDNMGDAGIGIGINSTTVNSATSYPTAQYGGPAQVGVGTIICDFKAYLPVGRTYLPALEIAGTTGTTSFYGQGDINGTPYQSAIQACIPM